MASLRLSPPARADLAAIDEYSTDQFGDEVAAIYSRGFKAVFDQLRRHPRLGEAKPKLGKGIRQITHRQHRIFYRVEGDVVQIVRVVHHAMDARRVLKGKAG